MSLSEEGIIYWFESSRYVYAEKWFAKWMASERIASLPIQEQMNIVYMLTDMAKTDLDKGVAQDWEVFAGGLQEGYIRRI